MLLEGKRIVVTGGVTGIGKATVLAMAKEGAAVVSMSRARPDEPRVCAVIDAACELGKGPVSHVQCDVRDQARVDAAFEEAVELLGGLDAMVNCAGLEHQGPADSLTAEVLLDQLSLHVCGTVFTNIAAGRHYRTVGGGAIINYGSYAGTCGMPMMAAYGAAKGGVIAYSRTIAKEWAPFNVRVNVVLPAVATELLDTFLNDLPPEKRAQVEAWFKASIPLGGAIGTADDAARLNVFLSSADAAFIHGQTIGVDGGMFMGR